MKRAILFVCFAALALAQQSNSVHHGDWNFTSDLQQLDGQVMHLSGHVVVESDSVVLRADAADFDQNSREMQVRGNVSVKLK